MKKLLLVIIAVMMITCAANAQHKKAIDPDNMPAPAVQLIQKHWPSCAVENAYFDGKKEYEVLLTDGTLIEFNSKGEWKEMKCTDGLPVTLVPVFITRYVVDRYPKVLIIDVEKLKGGYEATLANGLEIQFDLKGNVTHVDD